MHAVDFPTDWCCFKINNCCRHRFSWKLLRSKASDYAPISEVDVMISDACATFVDGEGRILALEVLPPTVKFGQFLWLLLLLPV